MNNMVGIGSILGIVIVIGAWILYTRHYDKKADEAEREQPARNGGPGPIKPK